MNEFECQCVSNIIKRLDIINNIIFVNTCAVTNESERQVRQKIRKLRRENPKHCLIITGCSSQLNATNSFNCDNIPNKNYFINNGVDFVIDNELKLKEWIYFLIKYWINNWNKSEKIKKKLQSIFFCENFSKSNDTSKHKNLANIKKFLKEVKFDENEKLKILSMVETDEENAWQIIDNFNDRSRAFVPIQTGCNHFCSFCIVPYSRGRSRSFKPELIIKQINSFVKNNYNEIVLTGIDITSYNYKDIDLGKLCLMILKKTNLKRLRLSSIDIAEVLEKTGKKILLSNREYDEKKIKKDIIELLSNERFMPYFHISLQSGSDKILRLMRRRHVAYDIIQFYQQATEIRKNITLGADIITGFPGETNEDFEKSKNIVKKYITFVHAFPYSKKKGTIAATTMKDDVDKKIKKERVKELIEIGELNLKTVSKTMNNTIQKMIVENGGIARAENFIKINIKNPNKYKIGSIIEKKVLFKKNNLIIED